MRKFIEISLLELRSNFNYFDQLAVIGGISIDLLVGIELIHFKLQEQFKIFFTPHRY